MYLLIWILKERLWMYNKIVKENIVLNCGINNFDYNCYDLEKNYKNIFFFDKIWVVVELY